VAEERGQGGHAPVEIWDYKVFIRKPRKKSRIEDNYGKNVCCPIVGCLPIDFDP